MDVTIENVHNTCLLGLFPHKCTRYCLCFNDGEHCSAINNELGCFSLTIYAHPFLVAGRMIHLHTAGAPVLFATKTVPCLGYTLLHTIHARFNIITTAMLCSIFTPYQTETLVVCRTMHLMVLLIGNIVIQCL